MSDMIYSSEPQDSQERNLKSLDETVWRAWLQKNFLQERQRAAARIKAVNWACIGVLLVAAVVSSYIFPSYVSTYQGVLRIIIALGATIMTFESVRTRQYVSTALFAGIALLFNPVLPAFALSGNWPILFASALPFFAALASMRERTHEDSFRASALR
jgi:uncharacterized protein DUF6804